MDMQTVEVLKAVAETPVEGEAKLDELFKSAEPAVKEAARVIMRNAVAFKESMSPEIMAALMEMAGYEMPEEKADGDKYEYPEPEAKAEDEKYKMPEEKACNPEDEMMKSLDAGLQKLWKSREEALLKAEAERAELEKVLKAERDERVRRQFIAKAETEFKGLPGKSEDVGELLKGGYEVSKEFGERLEGVLKAAHAALATGATFKELGTAASSDNAQSTWERIDGLARSMVAKSEGALKHYDAVNLVLKQHPEMYGEYLKERRG